MADEEYLRHSRVAIQEAYARRDAGGKRSLYAWHLPENLLMQYRLNSEMAAALKRAGWSDLTDKHCLDIGCGIGGWLRTLLAWGSVASNLHGIDLLPDRIERARKLSPNLDFQVSDAWPIPFADQSMDLVTANVVFSSILDAEARSSLADEMKRVVKTGSLILIYDFRISDPRNPDTIGINQDEIRRLFPKMLCHRQSLILAPPICRRVARLSPLLAYGMERCFPFMRTHAVYVLKNELT